MPHRDFKTWLLSEKADIYGFEGNQRKIDPLVTNELPIIPVVSDKLMEELCRHDLGVKKAKWDWNNLVEWGRGETGDLHVELSPLGSYKAVVRRKINDLEGTPIWICKAIHPIGETGRDTNEQAMADQLMEEIQKFDDQMVEMPVHEYDDMPRLVETLARKVIKATPKFMRFGGVMKNEKNHYTIILNPNGYGAEAPGSRRVEEFLIEMVFYPVAGVIRSWAYDVSSPMKNHRWDIEPSEWDEKFCPTQSIDEITDAIANAFYTY